MVDPATESAIVGALGGLIGTLLVGVLSFFARRWINSLTEQLDRIEKEQIKEKQRRKEDMDIIIRWLVNITKALQASDGVEDVDVPDGVRRRFDIEDNK